jgi:trigger factor
VQVTLSSQSDVQQEAEIQLTSTELQPWFDKAYVKYRAKAELKGFRKGKAPMEIIKKLYGEAIEHEALDDIANEVYHSAMEERNIHPLGRPSMTDMDFKRGEHFKFKITYEVKPVVELKTYKGIAVQRGVHQVTDADVEDELLQLRKVHSATSPADSAADDEHIVTADVQELDETGTPLVGKKSAGVRFYLADTSLVPEIKGALRNITVHDEVKARYTTRHDDHEHPVHIAITPKKIEKIELPPYDEALVKKVTRDKVASPDEFRASIRTDLERYWAERTEAKLTDDIASEIVRQHEFNVPDSLVEGILDSYVEEMRNRSRDRQLPAGFDEKKYREERRVYAVWQAKWMLLKERIAETEKIEVTDADLEKVAEEEATRSGLTKDKLLPHVKTSEAIRDRLLSTKVMTFLKDHARITDTVVTEPQH